MNERGSIYDLYFTLALLLIVTITVIVSYSVFSSLTTSAAWNETMFASGTAAEINATVASTNQAFLAFDSALVFFYILINLAAVISAAFVRTHPVFFISSILLLVFLCMLSAIFANVYYMVASNSFLAPFASQFPLLYNAFLYLPYISIVFGFLLAVVMYGKTPMGGQYEY